MAVRSAGRRKLTVDGRAFVWWVKQDDRDSLDAILRVASLDGKLRFREVVQMHEIVTTAAVRQICKRLLAGHNPKEGVGYVAAWNKDPYARQTRRKSRS